MPIEKLLAAGLQARIADGRLCVSPASRIDDQLANWIRRHRNEIVDQIDEQGHYWVNRTFNGRRSIVKLDEEAICEQLSMFWR